jgi:hypothetical protein
MAAMAGHDVFDVNDIECNQFRHEPVALRSRERFTVLR